MLVRRDLLRYGGWMGIGWLAPGLGTAMATDQAKRLPINIVNQSGNTNVALQELIKEGGFYDAFGLDPTIQVVSDGAMIMAALIGGDADVSMLSGFAQVFPAIEHGADVKVIGGGRSIAEQTLYTSRADIKTLADLLGRTVGVGAVGSLLHIETIAVLRKNGIDTGKIQFRNVGTAADVFRAVVAGTVDAGMGSYDVYDHQAKYGVHALTQANTWTNLTEYTSQGVYASGRAIREKREALVRVLAAYAQAYRLVSSPAGKDAYIRASKAALPSGDPEGFETEFGFFQRVQPFDLDIVLSEDRIRYVQELNVSLGMQKAVLPFDKVADMTMARDAIKLVS